MEKLYGKMVKNEVLFLYLIKIKISFPKYYHILLYNQDK